MVTAMAVTTSTTVAVSATSIGSAIQPIADAGPHDTHVQPASRQRLLPFAVASHRRHRWEILRHAIPGHREERAGEDSGRAPRHVGAVDGTVRAGECQSQRDAHHECGEHDGCRDLIETARCRRLQRRTTNGEPPHAQHGSHDDEHGESCLQASAASGLAYQLASTSTMPTAINAAKMETCTVIQLYDVALFASYLDRLRATPDGDGSLLDHVMLLYGGGISNSDRHTHGPLPTLLVGGGAGAISGGRHLVYPQDTPLTNLQLTLLNRLGVPVETLGDSTGQFTELSEL